MLIPSKGDMYNWVQYCWNPLGGECKQCVYCWLEDLKKRWITLRKKYSGPPYIVESYMNDNLYKYKKQTGPFVIFVCDCTDLFRDNVPATMIIKILNKCTNYPANTYLFQTKNPKRLMEFVDYFPKNSMFGVTLETNRDKHYSQISKAVYPSLRIHHFSVFVNDIIPSCKRMINIEPIADFDLDPLIQMIKQIKPDFVSIGADSRHTPDYPEPSSDKINSLINKLKEFTDIKIKDNLKRLI